MPLLVREARANLFSARARGFPLVILAVAVGALQVVVLATQERALTEELTRLQQDGRNIVMITGSDRHTPARIDESSCRALADDPAVVRAGGLGLPRLRDFVQLGSGITVVESSAGLFPELRAHDALIGSALADVRGARLLEADDGTILDAVAGRAQPTGVDTDYAVVVPGSFVGSGASACVVVLDLFADASTTMPGLVSQVSSTGGPIAATQAMSGGADPVRLHLAGIGRYLPAGWGLALALMAGVLTHVRAGELAAYRFSGTSARSLGILLSLEHLAVGGVLAAAGTAAALVGAQAFRDPAVPVISAVVSASVYVVAAHVLTVGVLRANPVDLAKDR